MKRSTSFLLFGNFVTKRSLAGLVLALSLLFFATGSNISHATIGAGKTLTLDNRVAYQRAIEEVYWKHTIWPEFNPQPKPPLSAVMSEKEIRFKVEEYLRKSNALDLDWNRPIAAAEMQAEINRMAAETRDPELLGELWRALGNDPYAIAECLARPILVERITEQLGSFDQWWQSAHKRTGMVSDAPVYPYRMAQIKDGAAFDPISNQAALSNSWTATSTTGAPSKRNDHRAVWTGTQMIVWGGFLVGTDTNTGGRYNPSTNSWSATSTIGAPSARDESTAIWTGTAMVVWGGESFNATPFRTGGRYNPMTNSWTATSINGAPSVRRTHTAIWTGSEMIVWGGFNGNTTLSTGGRYNPSTNSWKALSTSGAPSARESQSAVWAGTQMIVWGGSDSHGFLNTGGRYNPVTNSWTATTVTGAPLARTEHTGVWTGSKMIVWGGIAGSVVKTGGLYDPLSDSWSATTTTGAPVARKGHTAIWTGSKMIVWGGDNSNFAPIRTGGTYNPSTNTWSATTTIGAPSARDFHTAVWTGTKMIIWGGRIGINTNFNTGGIYTP